ncbi:MAG TPA: NAD(P)H-dependent oxidoreductase [Dongiaceae bacterium]|jgi:NAD(P)H-dependent FMN reductase|nr:NAD(P)H-dependent oxidoreductase [Dongiaceae bacterium]
MKAFILSGSHRAHSQSRRVADKIMTLLPETVPGAGADLLDLSETVLPFWHEGVWQRDDRWRVSWHPISARLKQASAFIVIAPEWAGMVPAGVKNFLLYCDDHELSHKPGLIVGVSASRGGAYPVAELRMSGYKNSRVCWIPDHVIVRQPQTELDKAPSGADHAPSISERLAYGLTMLSLYAGALDQVRVSPSVNYKRFPNGM